MYLFPDQQLISEEASVWMITSKLLQAARFRVLGGARPSSLSQKSQFMLSRALKIGGIHDNSRRIGIFC